MSIDLEAGYGARPEDVDRSVTRAVRAGAVGINPEDGITDETGIYGIDDQVARIRAATTLPVNVMMMASLPPR